MDPESPFNPIPPYISAVLRGEQPPPLHADDGGDCCYAPDAGRAIALLMTAETLRHDTYNVSSGRPFTNRELADALQAITPGLRLDLLPGRQDGPGDDPYLDITRLTARHRLHAGLRRRHGGRRLRRLARRQPPLTTTPETRMLDPDVRRVSTAPRSPTSPPSCRTARRTPLPVYVGTHGDRIVFFTGPGTRKARNLRRDPRLALSIAPADNPFTPVVIRGRVVEWIEGDAGLGDHRPARHQVHRCSPTPEEKNASSP